MYIYRGKLDFSPSDSHSAKNEGITTIFPSQFSLGNPVYTCWQWSTSHNWTNMPCWLSGIIDSVDNSGTDGNKISFYGGDYRFDGFLSGSAGVEELTLMVRSGNVVGTAMNTKLVFKPDSESANPGVIVPRIYLGRLANWAPDSIDETLLVVIPGGIVGEGNAICSFWQCRGTNVDSTPSKMTNVENVAGSVTFKFTDGSGRYNLRAITSSNETAEPQQLTLVMTVASYTTGNLTLDLQDLRPSPSGRQPRGVNDCTTVVINDGNKIDGGSQNKGSFLVCPSVEMSTRIVELTNKLKEKKKFGDSEQAVRDRDGVIAQLESKLQVTQLESQLRVTQLESQLRVAQLESQLRIAQLESQLQTSHFENKLLGTKLLETERAHEKALPRKK